MGGMEKTSVYLDSQQKTGLAQAVLLTGRSQADLVREGVDHIIHLYAKKRPAMRAVFSNASIVGRTDELLKDLGQ